MPLSLTIPAVEPLKFPASCKQVKFWLPLGASSATDSKLMEILSYADIDSSIYHLPASSLGKDRILEGKASRNDHSIDYYANLFFSLARILSLPFVLIQADNDELYRIASHDNPTLGNMEEVSYGECGLDPVISFIKNADACPPEPVQTKAKFRPTSTFSAMQGAGKRKIIKEGEEGLSKHLGIEYKESPHLLCSHGKNPNIFNQVEISTGGDLCQLLQSLPSIHILTPNEQDKPFVQGVNSACEAIEILRATGYWVLPLIITNEADSPRVFLAVANMLFTGDSDRFIKQLALAYNLQALSAGEFLASVIGNQDWIVAQCDAGTCNGLETIRQETLNHIYLLEPVNPVAGVKGAIEREYFYDLLKSQDKPGSGELAAYITESRGNNNSDTRKVKNHIEILDKYPVYVLAIKKA